MQTLARVVKIPVGDIVLRVPQHDVVLVVEVDGDVVAPVLVHVHALGDIHETVVPQPLAPVLQKPKGAVGMTECNEAEVKYACLENVQVSLMLPVLGKGHRVMGGHHNGPRLQVISNGRQRAADPNVYELGHSAYLQLILMAKLSRTQDAF